MGDLSLRLITMLGLLTVLVIIGLVLDYLHILRRPMRLGFWGAIVGIVIGSMLTYNALLPDNNFFGKVFTGIKTEQKIVALTFDDGPYPPYTNQVLDILREYQVPATFFVIGQNAENHPDLIRQIAAEGHQLGNHTYHHVDLLTVGRKKSEEEIDRTNQIVEDLTGIKMTIIRPPHGFRDPLVMEVMAEKHLEVVEWSIMARDWTNPGIDIIVNRIVSKVQNGSIILLHDGDGIAAKASRAQTVEATRHIILALTAKGYKFVTVNDIVSKQED
jgi:peptidoglycan/xylan/chitin deacetylase (PgdA/CDA1 family)